MKRILFFGTIAICVIIILNLMHSIYTLWHKRDVMTVTKEKLIKEQQEQASLKKQLAVVQSQQFIEEEARNKLFLVKPGESELIISQDLLKNGNQGSLLHAKELPHWQQWINLFFR